LSKAYFSTKEKELLEENLKKSLPEYLSINEKMALKKQLIQSLFVEVR